MVDRRSVRSMAAETAEVLRLHAEGKVTGTYSDRMKQNAREQLQDLDDNARDQDPALDGIIRDFLAALERDDAAVLRAIAERLFAMAGPRGPAR